MAVTSSRSICSLMPRSDSRSASRSVSGVAARSAAQSSRSNVRYRPPAASGTTSDPRLGAVPVSQRQLLGAWYTPPPLVDAVVSAMDASLGWRGDDRPGARSGVWRRAVPRRGRRDVLGARAIAARRRHRPGRRRRRCAPMRSRSTGTKPSFDVVVGNPPFLNQLATATTRGGSSRWGGGPYADAAAEFLALAVHVVRPGGLVGLVAAAVVARGARRGGDPGGRRPAGCVALVLVVGPAGVRRCGGDLGGGVGGRRPAAVRCDGPSAGSSKPRPSVEPVAGSTWSWSIADVRVPAVDPRAPRLGSIASFTVDFRDVYYGLDRCGWRRRRRPAAGDDRLDRPRPVRWGERPVRFAKRRWDAPRVDLSRLSPAMRRWADRRLVPKVLIANQARVIEAVHDPDGAWLPGVPVLTCTTEDPERVLGVLGSRGGDGMGAPPRRGLRAGPVDGAPDPGPAGLHPARPRP